MKQRIKDYLKFKRISQTEFSNTIGVSVSYITSIKKSIQPDKIARIKVAYPDLNIEWLMTGMGEMLNCDCRETGNVSVVNNGTINGNNNMNVESHDFIKDRIKQYLKFKRISQSEFSASIGVSNAYIPSIRRGIQPDKIARIQVAYPDLNIEWLITGRGEMLNRSCCDVVSVINNGTISGDHNMNVAGHAKSVNRAIGDLPPCRVEGVPVVPQELSREPKIDIYEYIQQHLDVINHEPMVHQFPPQNLWYNVYENSMSPDFHASDRLALVSLPKGEETILNNRTYVVDTYSNGMIVCRLRRLHDGSGYVAKYINPDYEDDFIPLTDVIRIFRVVGLLRNLL